jgi:tetratricopeptide (TPR) repeat protein
MPRQPKPLNPYASWTALLGATARRLRLELSSRPVVSQDELGRRISYDGSTVGAVERGMLRPDTKFIEACERELPAGGMLRAMLPFVNQEWNEWERRGNGPPASTMLPPAELTVVPDQLADVSFLEAASDGAVEAMELARFAAAPGVGLGTLESIERAVDRLCRDYPNTMPGLLAPRVQRKLRYVRQLLAGRLTLAEHRHLVVASGWLSLLLACLQFDLGDREAAEATRDAALQLGREGGHQEIMAWSFELLAWFALVDGNFRDTIDFAEAGLAIAPHTSAGVQLTVQEAKSRARLRDRRGAEDAMRQGATTLARLAAPSHPEHQFVFDPSKLSFYAATCYTWLGETERAEEHAREVIAQSIGPGEVVRWPTRLAVARLDLGLVAAQRGQPDEAAQLGMAALRSGRVVGSTLGWFAELDTMLQKSHPDLAEVEDFHEQYVLAHRSMQDGRT